MSERKDLPTPTSTNFETRVRETLMTYLGRTGDPLDRGVTLRDLLDSGLARLRAGRSVSSLTNGGTSLPIEPEIQDDPPDLTPPPSPTGFATSAAISHIFVQHDSPVYLQGHGHLRTRVYAKVVSAGDPLPVFSEASEIAQFTGTVHAIPSNPSTTWRVWIKWETRDGVQSVTPAGGTNGLEVRTGEDVTLLLEALTGEITEGQLYTSLQNRINLIDGSGAGSVNVRIANEATLRAQAITAEANTRLSGDQSLQNQINLLSSGTSGDLSALIDAVNTEAAARIAADIAESDARALADTTLNTALDAEEAARGIGDNVLSAITAALGTGVSGVSASIKQESDVRQGADNASASQTLVLQSQAQNAASALVVEQQVRAQADLSTASQVTTLAARVDIGDLQNTAGLVIEQQARADGDGALASQVTSLAAQAGQSLAAIEVEQDVRASQTESLAAQTTTIAAVAASNAAGLLVEQEARATADEATAAQITSLSASAAGLEAAIVVEQSVRAADDAATASQVTSVAARVDVGDSFNAAAIQQEQLARANADSAQASELESLSTAVGDNASAIRIERDTRSDQTQAIATQSQTIGAAAGSALAGLVAEQEARATADSAGASQIEQLAAKVGETVAGILIEQTVSADRDAALASQSSQLVAAVGQTAAGIVEEANARATADTASAVQVTAVAARVADSTAGIQAEQIVRATADDAAVRQITTLAADAGNNAAGIRTEQQARSDADSATATAITTLVSDVGDNAAAIDIEQQTRATQDSALANQSASLAAIAGSNVSAILQEAAVRSAADQSSAAQLTVLAASTGANEAGLVTETLTRSTETAALAAAATRLAAQVSVGALLPSDFTNGKTEWTNTAAGSPTTVAEPSGTIITNDADLGTCLEVTDFDAIGEALLTRGVVPATQGKVYRIVTTLKIVSSDGSVQLGHLASGLSATYTSVGTSTLGATTLTGAALGDGSLNAPGSGNVTLTGTGVFTISTMASSAAGAQYGAWPAGSVWLRLGVRLGTTEAGLVIRVGSIRIEEVTTAAGLAMEAFTRATQDNATSQQVTTLFSETGRNFSALQVASTTQATQDTALASQVTTLMSGTGSNTAAIQVSEATQTTQTSALASQVTAISSQVNDPTTGLPATRATLLNNYYTQAATDSAIAGATSTLVSTTALNTALGSYTNTAALQQDYYTKTATDFAISSATTTLQSSIDNSLTGYATTVALSTEATTRANADNSLFATYSVKIDNAGHVSGYGLASTANDATPTSEFGIRADKFWVAGPATVQSTAPTTDLYKGRAWVDTSVTPNVTRYYTGSGWSTTPQALPFAVRTSPGTVNGVNVPAGVYIDTAFIGKATIAAAQIGSLNADTIQAGYTSSVDIESATFFGSEFYIGGAATYEYSDPLDSTRRTGIASVSSPNIALTTTGANFDVGYFRIKNNNSLYTPFQVVNGVVYIDTTFIRDGTINTAKIADSIQSTNYSSSAGWQINKAGAATFNEVALRGTINGGNYSGYAWPAAGGTGFHLGPSGLLLGNANDRGFFQFESSTGRIFIGRAGVTTLYLDTSGNLAIGNKIVAQQNGTVYADNVDIRRRIVLQNGTLDTTDVVLGYYVAQSNFGDYNQPYPVGTVLGPFTVESEVLTDIYDSNVLNASSNQPYYVAAYVEGSTRNYNGLSMTCRMEVFGAPTVTRALSNTGNFPDDYRISIKFTFRIKILSGSFTSFRMPPILWTLFKL